MNVLIKSKTSKIPYFLQHPVFGVFQMKMQNQIKNTTILYKLLKRQLTSFCKTLTTICKTIGSKFLVISGLSSSTVNKVSIVLRIPIAAIAFSSCTSSFSTTYNETGNKIVQI